jgi:hypothetical protein
MPADTLQRGADLARKVVRPFYWGAIGARNRVLDWSRQQVVRASPSCGHRTSPVPFVVVAVYRRRNAHVLGKLLAQLHSADVHLWALDEPADSLAAQTVGSGPGSKWELANRLIAHAAPDPDAWMMVVDDDVCFSWSDGCRLVDLALRSGFDICQPAHGRLSLHSYEFNGARPLVRSSWTGFVEIGPLVLFSPRVVGGVYPFPEDLNMGWGTELYWHRLQEQGFRLGVVDRSRILHVGRVGEHYDTARASLSTRAAMAKTGISLTDTMQRHGTWWRWQATPPWTP